jgi:hypothetical protein
MNGRDVVYWHEAAVRAGAGKTGFMKKCEKDE